MQITEETLTVAGCRVPVRRKGAGAPLLFMHGAADGGVWLPVLDRLADTCEVIAPEHPGFGQADTPDWLDGIGDLAFFYLEFVRELGVGPVHVVGASIGGWIAAEMAVREPPALASMTLSAPAGIAVKGAPKGDLFLWSPEETQRRLFSDPAVAEAMPQAEGDPMLVQMKNREATARLGWNPRLHNPDLRKWLHRARVPTLIVWGADDQLLPPVEGEAFRDLIPGARLEVLAGCGHLPHVERADAFADLTLAHLAGAQPVAA
ncbi:alpha/beta fold hydrolase [Wenxinia marina]|uniref:Wenxma_14, whole genome shotgun sequence n=1 Tax=Wenxinia marina DSM 24838 TaxID=1123501 RepID=A0A0D0Q176_9RHOB|nr:alpha/beta fold hydrolase [Wenxinia marina]KIQ68324.1 putative hydrolase or acyltransferase (alpha/beta hydrolase superfamily) [Wenxinia marina DSM 24838]GGL79734.1 hydrolase [Wenxinia marina]